LHFLQSTSLPSQLKFNNSSLDECCSAQKRWSGQIGPMQEYQMSLFEGAANALIAIAAQALAVAVVVAL
jgi:hypothetical protein